MEKGRERDRETSIMQCYANAKVQAGVAAELRARVQLAHLFANLLAAHLSPRACLFLLEEGEGERQRETHTQR